MSGIPALSLACLTILAAAPAQVFGGPVTQDPVADPDAGEQGVRRPVPTAEALAAAESKALETVIDRLLWQPPDRIDVTQRVLLDAAQAAADDATRYVLLRAAIDSAERHGAPHAALAAIRRLASRFEVDVHALSVDLLHRMRERDAAEPAAAASVAIAALRLAREQRGAERDTTMVRYFDAALRAALATGDPALHEHVRRELPRLRDWHRWCRERLAGVDGDEVERRRIALTALMHGSDGLSFCGFDDLAPFLTALPADLRGEAITERPPGQLAALAELARDEGVRAGLLRCALARHAATWTPGDGCAAAVDLAERLADSPGITALRFGEPGDVGRLAIENGDWRVEDGVLLGASEGANNFATVRYAFSDIRAVVIRGGIRSDAGLNFRCKVGDVNLLLNWEVRPENHLWQFGRCTAKGPHALEPGKEHTIAMLSTPGAVQVFLDGEHWWTAPGGLAGTVTVYPALGSEIFVREILVVGEIESRVDGPRGTCM